MPMEQIALDRKSQPESQIPGKNNIPAWGWIGNVFPAWGNDRPSHPTVRKFAGMDREPPKPPFSDFADVPRDSPVFSQPPKPPKPPKGNGSPIFASRPNRQNRQNRRTAAHPGSCQAPLLAIAGCASHLQYVCSRIHRYAVLRFIVRALYLQVIAESGFRLTMVFRRSA